jgi:hypothetical protein
MLLAVGLCDEPDEATLLPQKRFKIYFNIISLSTSKSSTCSVSVWYFNQNYALCEFMLARTNSLQTFFFPGQSG